FYADWLYRTGRQKDAMALLRKTSGASGPPAIRAAAFGQLAVWDLLDGNRAAAIKDAEQAGQPTSPALLVIRFAAMPSASAQEWEARANRMMPAPQMERVRTLALAYALLFDGKQEAAIEQFEKAASAAPGTDFFVHAVYAKLNHQEQKLELVHDPNQLNEFAPVLD